MTMDKIHYKAESDIKFFYLCIMIFVGLFLIFCALITISPNNKVSVYLKIETVAIAILWWIVSIYVYINTPMEIIICENSIIFIWSRWRISEYSLENVKVVKYLFSKNLCIHDKSWNIGGASIPRYVLMTEKGNSKKIIKKIETKESHLNY